MYSGVNRTISTKLVWRLAQTPYSAGLLRRFFGLPCFYRHLFLRSDFVFRFRNSHQSVVKPADNVLQPLDAMPRLTGAGKLVGLVRETHHYSGNFAELQRTKHLLAACAGRRTIVCFPEDK